MDPYLSIVIPALNEAACIQSALQQLQPLRQRGHEIILVDGGSTDQTPVLAGNLADHILTTRPGRALQMNSGVATARGSILLFLHADTHLPAQCDRLIANALAQDAAGWGHFDVQLSGQSSIYKLISFCINLRSRITGRTATSGIIGKACRNREGIRPK